MRCNNCGKTIPDMSINCPFCNGVVDPYAKFTPSVDFGTVGATDYDEKHENSLTTVNKYLNNPKNKKYVYVGIIISIIIIVVFAILILSLFKGGNENNGIKYFNNVIDSSFDILDELFIDTGHHGTYKLDLTINEEDYDLKGEFESKLDDKYLYLKNHLGSDDNKDNDSDIIIGSTSLDFDIYLNKNNIYFKSDLIFSNNTLNIPINDPTGLLKTERYNINSLLEGIKTSLKKSINNLNIQSGTDNIDYRGENRSLSKYYIEFDSNTKIAFLKDLFEELKNDSNFINEYARIIGKNKTQATQTLDNYYNNLRYQISGNSKDITTVTIYYSGSKVYRIDIKLDEDTNRRYYLDIGENKYYFHGYQDKDEIFTSTLSYVERENENTLIRNFEFTFDNDNYIIDAYLELREAKSGRITKVNEFENLKNINELTEEELNGFKSNFGYYFKDNKIIDILMNNKQEEEITTTTSTVIIDETTTTTTVNE